MVTLLASPVMGQNLPSGFYLENAAGSATFSTPTAVAFAADGRIFVAEKRGRVYIIQNGTKLSTPFINLSAEVLNHHDRGLLGIALDPNFASNGRVYLMYTVDWNGAGDVSRKDVFGRVVRYTASTSNPNVADLSTRTVLLGADFSSGIAACYFSHAPGTLRFGADGTLLVSTGDGASYNEVDAGGLYPECFGTNRIPPIQDIGSFRSLYLPSMAGKILRIDPATGQGLPSNPYYTGNPNDPVSKVWAYGLRNPFRFSVRPDGSSNPANGDPGSLFIGDVGWGTWEEINVSDNGGGENFGWPCREGPNAHSGYQNASPAHSGCSSMSAATSPLLYWHHSNANLSSPPGLQNNAIVGGDFYLGSKYPSAYIGRVFYGDYTRGWIASASVDASNNFLEQQTFGTNLGAPVDIAYDPVSQYLYYVDIGSGRVMRVRHTNENAAPVAVATATPTDGPSPLTVQFTGSGSSDPNGGALTYSWDFDTGDTSTEADPVYTYQSAGTYTATLVVTEPDGLTDSDEVVITVGNSAPVAQILSPANGATVSVGETVDLDGSATDSDEPATNLSYHWEVSTVHNDHVHPATFVADTKTASFVVEQHGVAEEVGYLLIELTVTDSEGLTDVVTGYLMTAVHEENDVTDLGTPISLIDNPARDIDVIHDGVFPAVGSNAPSQQYDTDTGTARAEDWIGYSFATPRLFKRIVFQEGIQSAGGGWFDDLRVEVRRDGVWEGVLYLAIIIPYAGNDGENFNTYTLLFNAKLGDAVRIIGPPGGSPGYISVGELRVFDLPHVDFAAAPQSGLPPLTVDFTDQSTVPNPTSHSWDFGDGSVSSQQNPTHTYQSPGPYSVSLTVTNAHGPKSHQKANYVLAGAPGLSAEYYDDQNFSGSLLTRTDPVVDFDWSNGSPDPSMGADDFSVRWTGWVQPRFSETYTFHTITDDGVRLWVNNQLLIDQWIAQAATEWTGTVTLEADRFYPITMEYYEAGGSAVARLQWSSPSQAKETVPEVRLFSVPPPAANTPPTASFNATPASGDAPLNVAFDAAGSFDPDGSIVAYDWEFGDGATATGVTTGHTYSSPGAYTAVLTVTDDQSATATHSELISVTAPPQPGGPVSDDFSPNIDGSIWTFVNPLGDASLAATGTQAALSVPAGTDHDPWGNNNTTARLMQAAEDADFEIEVKFESALTQQIQSQGLLVQESPARYLRFDVYFSGSSYMAFCAFIDGGVGGVKVNQSIPGGAPLWLRVSRTGDSWTYRYSLDGASWTTATTFTQALSVAQVGAFAGNFGGGSAPAHTAVVDYFFNTAAPIIPEDGTGEPDETPPVISSVDAAPGTTTATITWTTDEPATSRLDYGLDPGYGSVKEELTLKTNHALSISGLSPDTQYHYQVGSTDASGNAATSGDFVFTTTSAPTGITSDDFSSPSLNTSLWTFVDPLADASVSVNGTQAELAVPSGTNHDPWGSNNTAARIMQGAVDEDFEVEVKFESGLTAQIQSQGLLVEESPDSYLRFDVYYNGSTYQIFCAYLNSGSGSVKVHQAISGGTPFWLRVTRAGDTWTYRYSLDGTSWTTATTFSQALSVAQVGVFAGNFGGGSAPAHTAIVDYFFNTAAPIVPEDGGAAARIASATKSSETASDLTMAVKTELKLPLAPDLRAVQVGADVVLTWSASVPGAAYDVQSGAGELFETRATAYAESLPADPGNPYGFRQELTYVERNVTPGTHRFRLQQSQTDGATRESEVVEVEVMLVEEYRLTDPYPNPFNVGSQMTLTVREAQHVKVEVYDALGRRVTTLFDQDLRANAPQRIYFDASGLSSGLYLIRAAGESFVDYRRLVLLQ